MRCETLNKCDFNGYYNLCDSKFLTTKQVIQHQEDVHVKASKELIPCRKRKRYFRSMEDMQRT